MSKMSVFEEVTRVPNSNFNDYSTSNPSFLLSFPQTSILLRSRRLTIQTIYSSTFRLRRKNHATKSLQQLRKPQMLQMLQ